MTKVKLAEATKEINQQAGVILEDAARIRRSLDTVMQALRKQEQKFQHRCRKCGFKTAQPGTENDPYAQRQNRGSPRQKATRSARCKSRKITDRICDCPAAAAGQDQTAQGCKRGKFQKEIQNRIMHGIKQGQTVPDSK